LHVGGTRPAGRSRGIHWHASPQNVVEYVAVDPQRQQIGYVKVTSGGETREYFAEGVTESQIANAEPRQMECVDCHNRAGHPFARSADRAVNEVIAAGGFRRIFRSSSARFLQRSTASTRMRKPPPRKLPIALRAFTAMGIRRSGRRGRRISRARPRT
jgi:hypothetical protein